MFNLYQRVKVKLGDEEHVFDRKRLMYTEVTEIERITGLKYPEWERELADYSMTAVGALLHILRQRAEMPSDYLTMQFNVGELEVIPLNDDGSEMTTEQAAADLISRMNEAAEGPGPTLAAGVAEAAARLRGTSTMSPASPSGSASGRGNGSSSRGRASAASRRGQTRG